MSHATFFSPDYLSARARFRASAHAISAEVSAYPIAARGPDGEELTIDVARLGPSDAPRSVVVSSATHGVEGYLGSAIQAFLLEETFARTTPPEGCSVVLLHAVNPYGYAHTRRVNESNIDLNRNFLRNGELFEGSPDGYAGLDGLLNPRRAPARFDFFAPRAALKIAQHGIPALKQSIAAGQYDYPAGLFYGGSEPSESQRILAEHLPRWVGGAKTVHHVDIHTGLGASGTYKLMVDHGWGTKALGALGDIYGSDVVEAWEPEKGVSYAIRGGLGMWCKQHLASRSYDVLAAEFGTVHVLKVIRALVRENQAHHHGSPDSSLYRRAKAELRDAFAPRDGAWRETACREGVAIVRRALGA